MPETIPGWSKKGEYAAYMAFAFAYTMLLLGSAYGGVMKYVAASFYVTAFLLCSVVLILMVDKLDIPCFWVDRWVVASTVVGALLVFLLVGLPPLRVLLETQMGARLEFVSPFEAAAWQFLLVALSESMIKYIVVRGLMEGFNASTPVAVAVPAVLFAFLHVFRYGFGTLPFLYTLVMGGILVALGFLPRALGSHIQFSIVPMIVAHGMHNVLVGGYASALYVRGV